MLVAFFVAGVVYAGAAAAMPRLQFPMVGIGIGACASCSGGVPGAGLCICSGGCTLPLSVCVVSPPLASSWTSAVLGICSAGSC